MINILIIDGDEYKSELLENILHSIIKCNIIKTVTKTWGIRLFKSHPIDLVITDTYMPVYKKYGDIEYCIESIFIDIRKLNKDVPICVCSNKHSVSSKYYNYNINYKEDEIYLKDEFMRLLNSIM